MNESASGILATTIEKVRQLVDVSTIVGEPILGGIDNEALKEELQKQIDSATAVESQ